jgi:hypothetical protein
VAAGVDRLDGKRVDARLCGCERLRRRGDGLHEQRTGGTERLQILPRRDPEREADERSRLGEQEPELLAPPVVVLSRMLAVERQAEAIGLAAQRIRIAAELVTVHR